MDPEKPKKPGDSAFKQQKLKSWNINLSKNGLGLFYIFFGSFFLIIGSIIVVESNDVIEHKMRYDNLSDCKAHWKVKNTCILELDLDEKMDEPIYIYYEISNMYQNHRKYNKNRDSLQLMGNTRSKSEVSDYCDPVTTMEELGFYTNNTDLNPKSVANPCGLIAKSVFNDSYSIVPASNIQEPVKISFNDISVSIDRNEKFKRNDHRQLQWIDVEDGKVYIEHFIVWMSIAGLPTFKKLWGKIEHDLPKGKYYVSIESNYDVSDFDGKKSFILTTVSNLGGKMSFLGVVSLIIGSVSVVGGLIIIGLAFYLKRKGIEF